MVERADKQRSSLRVGWRARRSLGPPLVRLRCRGLLPRSVHPNYRLFFIGQLVSLIGTWMQNVAQAWLVYALTGSPLLPRRRQFCLVHPVALVSLGAGVVIDRVPTGAADRHPVVGHAARVHPRRRRFLGWVQPWHIVILSFLLGAVNAFDGPTAKHLSSKWCRTGATCRRDRTQLGHFLDGEYYRPDARRNHARRDRGGLVFLLNGVSFIAVIAGLWAMQMKPLIHTQGSVGHGAVAGGGGLHLAH